VKLAILSVLAIAACGACVADPKTHVRVVAEADQLAGYVDGANAWTELGYAADFEDTGEPECHEVRDVGCQITIVIQRRAGLRERYHADALTDRGTRTIIIDDRWSDWALLTLAAHETGHILLDTGRHAEPGKRAIMAAQTGTWSIQPADIALACETIGVCE